MRTKTLIIGGAGEMGRWLARFLKRQDMDVAIADIDTHTPEIADELGVSVGDVRDVGDFDIVLVSVPIDETEDVISRIAPKMRLGSLLTDVTSVKKGPMEAMKKAPDGVEVIGMHPMFGHTVPDVKGQTVILVPVKGRTERWLPRIRTLLEDNGAHVEILSAEEHDRITAVVQGLTHFAYISTGATLAALDFEVGKSRRFMSPVYEIMIDFVGRILAQNPHLYATIQTNPEVEKVRDTFIDQCKTLSEFVKKGNMDRFVRSMRKAAAHFGDTEAALRRSDKLVNAKIAEIEELMHSIGEERALQHIYSSVVHIGAIRKVTPQTVALERNGKVTKLKLENVKLLTPDELKQWKIENLRHHKRDISVVLAETVKPEIIARIVREVDSILSAEVIDTFKLKEGHLSITLRVVILGDRSPKDVQGAVEELLKGIGGKIR
ncbi:MAG: prephenate dehydrogenase [Methanosarcinales archaeon]|nr:MAG: prephenate dehydrogenase [Methanosarcinales archaeon]